MVLYRNIENSKSMIFFSYLSLKKMEHDSVQWYSI